MRLEKNQKQTYWRLIRHLPLVTNWNNLLVFNVGYATEFRGMRNTLTPAIEIRIFTIRDKQVMPDRDVAELFQLQTKRLIEQVKRNVERYKNLSLGMEL
jgi:hypothetical protein